MVFPLFAASESTSALDVVGTIIMVVGAVFALVATIGLHRFDDVFARMHAAGKASTLALGLILLGAAIRIGDDGTFAKLFVVGVMALITIPAGVHIIGRAAYRSGTELAEATALDELGQARRLQATIDDVSPST